MSDLASLSGGVLSVYMSQEYEGVEGVGGLLALMSVINFLVTPQIIHFANLEGRRSAPGERVVRSLLLRAGIPALLGVMTIGSLLEGSTESVVFLSLATIVSVPVGALIDIALARRPRGAARAAAPPLTPAALTARALERPERLPSWVVGGE
jgi:predicted lipid-binding transport protein (Tim44 family)